MDARAVHANVLMQIPEATLMEINKYLQLALDEINSLGKETITALTVVNPDKTPYGTPSERTVDQAFNYYPDAKCLVLPSSVVYVAKVYVNGTVYSPLSATEYLSDAENLAQYDGKAYYQNNTNELYFISDLTEGDTVKVLGRIGGNTLAVLPDSYLSYMTYYVLSGLYSSEYKNADAYAVVTPKLAEAKRNTMQETQRLKWNKRNGRLY